MQGRHGNPLDEWTLESRWRYGIVWGGLNVAVHVGLQAMFGSIPGSKLLLLALAVFLVVGLAQAFIAYPRAKQKAPSTRTVTR